MASRLTGLVVVIYKLVVVFVSCGLAGLGRRCLPAIEQQVKLSPRKAGRSTPTNSLLPLLRPSRPAPHRKQFGMVGIRKIRITRKLYH